MNATVYILGILLQATAAVIALLQVRYAPRKLPWLLIALSSLLIVARRLGTLGQVTNTGKELATAEILTLVISLLFFLGVILMSQMFSEVWKAHGALKNSETRHRLLFDSMLDGYAHCEMRYENGKPQDFVYLEVNLAFERLTGLKNVAGKKVSEVIPGHREAEPELFAAYARVIQTGQPERIELHLKAPLNFWLSIAIYSPEPRHFVAIFDNTTEQKRMEAEREKLEAQNRQLQKSESLGRMAGAIAHHFNNQLAAVMMNLELVKNDVPQNAGFVANLNEALQSAHKAAEVSSLMLTYLGQTHSRHEPVDFAEVCRQHLPVLRATLAKGVELETDFPSPGPTIIADSNQIQQVLSNLLTNAEEASGEGKGTIRLIIKTISVIDIPSTRRFPIDYQPQEKNYACLEVADTGCGIAEADIEKLFDPFYSTKFIGRGLGLPVVLGIVRAHQGVITVESKPGRGSIFRVFLPVSAEAALKKPLPVAKAPKIAGGGTVLVVDDESSVRNAMSKAFKHLGFTVLAAADGAEAVEVFRQHQTEIRLVLCDLTMPRMNGWETLVALRQISPGILVILSSGYSEVQALAGQHTELPQAFLGKPYNFEELRDTLAKVLDKA